MDLQVRARKGISILEYLREYVRPFLSSQLYYQANGHYPGGEHRHGFVGKMDRYFEVLNTQDPSIVIKAFNIRLNGGYPPSGHKCWCGSGLKYEQCHLKAMKWLQAVFTETIQSDRRILLVLVHSKKFELFMKLDESNQSVA